VDAAVRYRTVATGTSTSPAAQHSGALLQGVALESMGRLRDAAILYDSAASWEFANDFPSSIARRRTWVLTHVASALAAGGDTARLPRLADSLKLLGERSGFGRDRLLHHHVRGLLYVARGQDSLAIEELKAAIYSITGGTRVPTWSWGRSTCAGTSRGKPSRSSSPHSGDHWRRQISTPHGGRFTRCLRRRISRSEMVTRQPSIGESRGSRGTIIPRAARIHRWRSG
jgi:hypothetical protein